MKNWGSLEVTNVLLLIIAIFLLIMVIQSSDSAPASSSNRLSRMGAAPTVGGPIQNPHDHDHEESGEEENAGFSFQNMAFAAMKCPNDGTISLADVACKGNEAKERREYVSKLVAQNLPPRMLFDQIIEKFGEKALTDEAL